MCELQRLAERRVRRGSQEHRGHPATEEVGQLALILGARRRSASSERVGAVGKETVEPYFRFIGEMWQAIGQPLDGRDTDVPWSAAAISFIVRQAGTGHAGYMDFRFAASHARYMHDSIAKRDANQPAPFWGFRLEERPPQIGDIIGRWRETPRTFDDARHSDSFKSHSDIIVSVGAAEVLAIGGNIANSVSVSRYPKEPSGHLSDSDGAFMLMVNRL